MSITGPRTLYPGTSGLGLPGRTHRYILWSHKCLMVIYIFYQNCWIKLPDLSIEPPLLLTLTEGKGPVNICANHVLEEDGDDDEDDDEEIEEDEEMAEVEAEVSLQILA